ncbi:unnamed protein product [Pleuronectes platessa]|uniref:Uncharacterized protein n=1 Tax=Pleuronectes platessa TaxID=8262 RepID=A0A9N7TLZ8_PLEPL|nr:unnamed protein product [Pleuronectes platessa]
MRMRKTGEEEERSSHAGLVCAPPPPSSSSCLLSLFVHLPSNLAGCDSNVRPPGKGSCWPATGAATVGPGPVPAPTALCEKVNWRLLGDVWDQWLMDSSANIIVGALVIGAILLPAHNVQRSRLHILKGKRKLQQLRAHEACPLRRAWQQLIQEEARVRRPEPEEESVSEAPRHCRRCFLGDSSPADGRRHPSMSLWRLIPALLGIYGWRGQARVDLRVEREEISKEAHKCVFAMPGHITASEPNLPATVLIKAASVSAGPRQ